MTLSSTDLKLWSGAWGRGQTPWVNKDSEKFLVRSWRQLRRLGLQPKQRVLVPLCGASPSIRFFLLRKFDVTGVEYVPGAITALIKHDFPTKKLKKSKIKSGISYSIRHLEIIQQDFFKFSARNHFHFIYDRAALVAIRPKLRIKYAKILTNSLTPGGLIFLVTYTRVGGRVRGAPYQISRKQLLKLFPSMTVAFKLDQSTRKLGPRFKDSGVRSLTYSVTVLQKAHK